MTTNRIELERRYSEFKRNESTDMRYYGAVSAHLLRETGWQFVQDTAVRAADNGRGWLETLRGWWINPNDTEHNRPAGDSKYFKLGAYNTVALYTDIEMETITSMAAAWRLDDLKLSLSSR